MSAAGRRVLITGGTGYLGGRLALALAAERWQVSVAARSRRAWPEGLAADFLPLELPAGAEKLRLEGFDSLVNLAAANELQAAANPTHALAVTAEGAAALAAAARAFGLRRFVQLSTVHVYGTLPERVTEELEPQPVHPYGAAHLAAERAVLRSGTEAVVLRLANVIGAPASTAIDRWTLVGNDLCRQAAVQKRLTLRSDGASWRSFLPMAAALAAIRHLLDLQGAAPLYHLGGAPQPVRRLAERIASLAGGLPLELGPPATMAQGPFMLDCSRLLATGFHFDGALEPDIQETLAFCRRHAAALAAEGAP
jgi:UDP-glucose 4-epimerase